MFLKNQEQFCDSFEIDQCMYNLNVQQRSLANLYRSKRSAPKKFPRLEALMRKFKLSRHKLKDDIDADCDKIDADCTQISISDSDDDKNDDDSNIDDKKIRYPIPMMTKKKEQTLSVDWENLEELVFGSPRSP